MQSVSNVIVFKPSPVAALRQPSRNGGEFHAKLWDSTALGGLRNTAMNRVYDVRSRFPALEDTRLLEIMNRLSANAHIKANEDVHGVRVRAAMGALLLHLTHPGKSMLSTGEHKALEAAVNRVAALDVASKILKRLSTEWVVDAAGERLLPPPKRARDLIFRADQFCKGNVLLRE